MCEFKVGDRVEYTGADACHTKGLIGKRGRITEISEEDGISIHFEDQERPSLGVLAENLQHANPITEADANIARLESELAAAREKRAALEPRVWWGYLDGDGDVMCVKPEREQAAKIAPRGPYTLVRIEEVK